MKTITKIAAIFLTSLCLLTGCSTQSAEEKALQTVREQSSQYAFLNKGRNACQTLVGMLSYYNNRTYQEAKESANVSDNLRVKYFPSVNWQGTELLSRELKGSITELLVSSCSDRQIEFLFCLQLDDGYYVPTNYWYRATYSIKQDMIINLELIFSY